MASPICTIADGGGAPQSTLDGVDVTSGDTITIALQSNAGVGPWAITCTDTDETNVPATITAGLTIDPLNKRATFTAPANGSALRFQSVVNNGLNADGKIDPSLTATFGVYVRTASGNRVGSTNETYESNHLYGWLVKFNQMLRAAPSGTGVATYTSDGASGAIAKGQCVCLAPGGLTVTLATAAALTAAGAVLGVATTAGTAGQSIIVNVEAMVPNSVSGLGTGAASPVRVNTSTSVLQRVSSFGTSDYPVGYCNTAGDVTMVRGIVVGVGPTGTAGGALGGTYPNPTIAMGGSVGGSSGAATVVAIDGAAGVVPIGTSGNILKWNAATTNPGVAQADNTTNSATAANLTLNAQNATGTTAVGGTVSLLPGTGTSRYGSINLTGSIFTGMYSFQPVNGTNTLTAQQSSSTLIYTVAGATAAVTITSVAQPTFGRMLFLRNNTSQTITFGWASGTTVTIATNTSAMIIADGVNAIKLIAGT